MTCLCNLVWLGHGGTMSVGLAVRRGVDMDLDCGANRGGYDLELSDLVVLNTSVKQGFGSLSGEPPSLFPRISQPAGLTQDRGRTSVEVCVLLIWLPVQHIGV